MPEFDEGRAPPGLTVATYVRYGGLRGENAAMIYARLTPHPEENSAGQWP